VESFPGTMAIIASRSATGGIDIVMSQALTSRFRKLPAGHTP
jgi:hypothetical protein